MMRIITGSARGVHLETLPGNETRPTSERVKAAVFSSLQFVLEGRRVLDLFAGSGQMGLEALSRGGSDATFIDASQDAMAIVKENAKRTGFFDRSHFLCSDYRNMLRKYAGRPPYDLIFIDPPYPLHAAGDAVERLLAAGLASDGALIVTESGEETVFAENSPALPRLKTIKAARYSVSYIHIFEVLPRPQDS